MHIDVHQSAVDDIEKLWASDPRAAATVITTLQEMQADPEIVEKLTQHGDNLVGVTLLNVKRWQRTKQVGSLWRFRILNTPATSHRVVYGYHWQTRQVCVLAVVHKDEFNYDPQSDIGKRILGDWTAL